MINLYGNLRSKCIRKEELLSWSLAKAEGGLLFN